MHRPRIVADDEFRHPPSFPFPPFARDAGKPRVRMGVPEVAALRPARPVHAAPAAPLTNPITDLDGTTSSLPHREHRPPTVRASAIPFGVIRFAPYTTVFR